MSELDKSNADDEEKAISDELDAIEASPEAPAEEPQAAAPAAEAPAPQPEPAAPSVAAPEAAPPVAMPAQPSPAASAPEAAPENPEPMSLSAEQLAARKTAQNAQFYQDMTAGHIKPKTYSDLYHDKSVLGKIGTIFGLMLSGAGSGLAHQPNALLDMMNKELERDFEAQKASAGNKQNWYRMAMEHERMLPEVAEKYAHAASAEEKAKFDKWTNQQAGIDELSATANAINSSSAGALHSMQSVIDMMPMGPKKEAAQWTQDNVTIPYMLNKAAQRNLEVEQKRKVVDAVNPMPVAKANPPPKGDAKPGVRYDAYKQAEYARRAALGRALGEKAGASKDAIPVGAQPELDKEAADLTANRSTYADAVKSFHKLAGMEMAGQAPGVGAATKIAEGMANFFSIGHQATAGGAGDALRNAFEQERNTQRETLITKMARGNISRDQAEKTVDSFMPSFIDINSQEKLQGKFEQLKNHFTSAREEGATGLKKFGLYYDPPKYNFRIDNKKSTIPNKEKFIPAQSGKNKE